MHEHFVKEGLLSFLFKEFWSFYFQVGVLSTDQGIWVGAGFKIIWYLCGESRYGYK